MKRFREVKTGEGGFVISDSNWSVTETEETRLSGSWTMSQSMMWPDL